MHHQAYLENFKRCKKLVQRRLLNKMFKHWNALKKHVLCIENCYDRSSLVFTNDGKDIFRKQLSSTTDDQVVLSPCICAGLQIILYAHYFSMKFTKASGTSFKDSLIVMDFRNDSIDLKNPSFFCIIQV